MKHNPLPSQDEIKKYITYNPDTGEFMRNRIPEITGYDKMVNSQCAGKSPGKIDPLGYHTMMFNRKAYLAHRLAWMYVYNVDPGNNLIDHIDGNPSNNRISNLRLAKHRNNSSNMKKPKACRGKPTKSKYKGAYLSPVGKWYSQIKARGKHYSLGMFQTEKEAAHAYNEAAQKLHGEFAKLNTID